MSTKHDKTFKIIIIGDPAIGKSTLLYKYLFDEFNEKLNSTIGVDYQIKNMTTGDHNLKLHIWDTAGQEKFMSLTQNYFRNADAVILCFDLTNKKSFMNLDKWYNSVCVYNPYASFILVGTKSDLIETREVNSTMITSFINDFLVVKYIECSSIYDPEKRIKYIFDTCAQHLLNKLLIDKNLIKDISEEQILKLNQETNQEIVLTSNKNENENENEKSRRNNCCW
jgi:small GTP-binding protein